MAIRNISNDEKRKHLPRLLHLAKRNFDIWAFNVLGNHIDNFKISYIPFLMNINPAGSTNNEIAANAFLPKQGMSKLMKELMEKGLIKTEKTLKDKRSTRILLTQKGEEFFEKSWGELLRLSATYKTLVGEKKLQTAIEVLNKIIEYHESLRLEAAANE